jgi:hypothetical protein
MIACEPSTSVIVAPARCAIEPPISAVCSAGRSAATASRNFPGSIANSTPGSSPFGVG